MEDDAILKSQLDLIMECVTTLEEFEEYVEEMNEMFESHHELVFSYIHRHFDKNGYKKIK
jgi:hypothetical protein